MFTQTNGGESCISANGEPSRTRTCDPLVKSQLLYRLSYRPIYRRMSTQARARFQLRGSSMRILPKRDRIVQRHDLSFVLCVLCFAVHLPPRKSSAESERSHSVRSGMFIE